VRELIDGAISLDSNWSFGCIANTCGMIVEWGGTPSIAVEPILDRITIQFERIPDFVEAMQTHLGIEHPNQIAENDWPTLGNAYPEHAWVIGEWYALRFMGCAAMTMLCRDVQIRKRARNRIDLMQRAEAARSDNPYAYYLAETLGMIDDERLLVLDTTRSLGFHVQLTAIRNNFHFFTLLQDAIQAHNIQPLAVALAKGERMLAEISPNEWAADGNGENDAANWSYYPWTATKATSLEWIWGEAKPTDIPPFDGVRVVVLCPLEAPRTWSVGYFAPLHPALRSAVQVESSLSKSEYDDWMQRLKKNHG
jgi:hypothetical protein